MAEPAPAGPAAPYDALLLVGFGGPEGPEDVVPFLENVTRRRGIPRERLEQVGEHYHLFGGRSPINDQNRALLAALRDDLAAHGIDLPVYWGNRNWDPYLADALAAMAADGVTRAACFVTSAYSSWSSCRQYRENLFDATEAARAAQDAPVPQLDKLRHYFNHPGFVAPVVDGVLAALEELPDAVRDGAHLAFTTHSIPTAMAEGSGPEDWPEGPGAYVDQHRDVAAVVAAAVAERRGVEHPHALVYCSRSGAPSTPWLEPDVNDHLEALHADGVSAVVVVPVGFVSDHMEVIYDLDTEAAETAERLGLPMRRSATAGTDPRFVAMVRELLLERADAERGGTPERPALGTTGALWDRCSAHCCPNPRGERPALCQEPAEASA